MKPNELPRLVEPEQLEAVLGDENLLVVDLSRREQYAHMHVPGAVHLDYGLIVRGTRPAPGLLPDPALLSRARRPPSPTACAPGRSSCCRPTRCRASSTVPRAAAPPGGRSC